MSLKSLLNMVLILWIATSTPNTDANPFTSVLSKLQMASKAINRIDEVRDFVLLRAGPIDAVSYWHHTGVLRNPVTGRVIAGIEGIEMVTPVEFNCTNTPESNSTIFPRSSYSYSSSKAFVYVESEDPSRPLESFRVRPNAPKRPVHPFKEYASTTTIAVGDSNRTVASIQWPSGRETRGTAQGFSLQSAEVEGASRFDRWRGRRGYEVRNFMMGGKRRRVNRFVALSGATDSGHGRTQESYRISFRPLQLPGMGFTSTKRPDEGVTQNTVNYNQTNTNVRSSTGLAGLSRAPAEAYMVYQRYGESPSWWLPGRPCLVEMHSRRYPRIDWIPRSTRVLLESRLPPLPHCSFTIKRITLKDRKQGLVASVGEEGEREGEEVFLGDPLSRHRPFLLSLLPQRKR